MARIAGVNIPTNKRVVIALQYIHGIGAAKARDLALDSAEVLRFKPCVELRRLRRQREMRKRGEHERGDPDNAKQS